jgi:hypothetical protein
MGKLSVSDLVSEMEPFLRAVVRFFSLFIFLTE